jgi:flagellar biosynthesis/type III secretory pathway M-ring protein FliF/YscJ
MDRMLNVMTVFSILLLGLVLASVRRAHIRVEYSVSWLAAALVLLAIVAFMIARRKKGGKTAEVEVPAALPRGSREVAAPNPAAGMNVEKELESQLAERDAAQQRMDSQALSSLKLAPVITKKAEVFAKHLREKMAKEPEVSAQILKSWIREEED